MVIKAGTMMVARQASKIVRRHCACCGDELDAHQAFSSGVCDRQRCRDWKIAKVGAELLQRRRQQILDGLFEVMAPSVEAAAAAVGGTPESVVRATTQWQASPVVPLPEARRAAFREHLEWIAGEAFGSSVPDEDPGRAGIEADEAPVLAAACALCRGKCCDRGGTTAMLGEEDIGRWRRRQPGATAEAIVAVYMAALPEESVEGSCVYLGAAGCVLPRAMRNDWCNGWQCKERENMQSAMAEAGGEQVVMIADDADTESAGAVAGWSPATGTVVVPLVRAPDAEADADAQGDAGGDDGRDGAG